MDKILPSSDQLFEAVVTDQLRRAASEQARPSTIWTWRYNSWSFKKWQILPELERHNLTRAISAPAESEEEKQKRRRALETLN